MASRELMQRFINAASTCERSTLVGQRSDAAIVCMSMCSPSVRAQQPSGRRHQDRSGRSSRASGPACGRRPAAAAVNSAALFARLEDALCAIGDVGGRSSCSRIELASPRTMVRILLKSCATPPVIWPTASIFCSWKSCSLVSLWLSITSCRLRVSTAMRRSKITATMAISSTRDRNQGGDSGENRLGRG